jgi:hypothetical protein
MAIDDVLRACRTRLTVALAAIDADPQASPILAAVVREFERKLAKAEQQIAGADDDPITIWEAIVELEQAGDSARAAALADPAASLETRQSVEAAHDIVTTYKAAVGRPSGDDWLHRAAETGTALLESAAEFAVGAAIAPFTGSETVPIVSSVASMLDAGVDRLTHLGERPHPSRPEEAPVPKPPADPPA